MGAGISSATTCRPAARLWPARRARATSSNASGSWLAKVFSRTRRLFKSQPNGTQNMTSPNRGARTSGTRASQLAVAPRKASTRPMPNSVLGLMWQSAWVKIFWRLGRLGVISSRNDFLSRSKADFFRMSAPPSSFRFRPVRVSRRSAAFPELKSRRTNISSPTRAATARNAVTEISTGVMAMGPWLVPQEHALLEQVAGELDARRLQPVHEAGPHAAGLEMAEGPPVLVDAQLLEPEDVLHDYDVLLHVHHLGDAGHLARPALEAVGLDDQVHR